MVHVATVPLQRTVAAGMQRAQAALAATQRQLDSGKKAQDFAGLGSDTLTMLSSRSLLAREEAHTASATRLGTRLALYDANITQVDTTATDLRKTILSALGTGQTAGLQQSIEGAFGQLRTALNATDGSDPLFAGGQSGAPFVPATLADTAGLAPADAFTNDDVRASTRVGDGVDLTYGVTAKDLGTGLLAAFRTLAEAGTIGETATVAQADAMKTAMAQIDAALPKVRAINAENGRLQAQAETMGTRAEERRTLLEDAISRVEDADYGQIATDLAQQQAVLKASYSVFSQLSQLSLVDYLR